MKLHPIQGGLEILLAARCRLLNYLFYAEHLTNSKQRIDIMIIFIKSFLNVTETFYKICLTSFFNTSQFQYWKAL